MDDREYSLNCIKWQWEYSQSIKWRFRHPIKALMVWKKEWRRFLSKFI